MLELKIGTKHIYTSTYLVDSYVQNAQFCLVLSYVKFEIKNQVVPGYPVTSAGNVAGFLSSVPEEKVYVIVYRKEDVDPDPPQHDENSGEDSDVVPCFDCKPYSKQKSIDLDSDSNEKGQALRNAQQQAEGREQGIIDLDSDSNKDDEDPEQPPDSNRKRKIINLDCDSNEDDKAKDSANSQQSQHVLANFSEEERATIAGVLRSSARLAAALKTLSTAVPNLTTEDKASSSYVSKYTLRNWWRKPQVLEKILEKMALPKKTAKMHNSRAGSVRSSLTPETRKCIAAAMATAKNTSDFIAKLTESLPGFSTTNSEAGVYIPRGTLHNWMTQETNRTWFANVDPAQPQPWTEEYKQVFTVSIEKPNRRVPAGTSLDDASGQYLLYGSWTFCPTCGRRRPRQAPSTLNLQCTFNPAAVCHTGCDVDAQALLAPRQAHPIRSQLEGYVTPLADYWQPWTHYIANGDLPLTRLLSEKELKDLAVVDIKVEFVSKRGGNAEVFSKQKRSVVRCRWRAESLCTLKREDLAARAFSWLLANNSTYAEYVQMHNHIIEDAGKDDSWRELPTARLLLSSPAIEVAARPWLYPLASMADTDMKHRLVPLGWLNSKQTPSARTSFMRKLSSRCIDYSRDFPLQCLLYDTCMARTITSVMSVANQKHIAPEQAASDMDMFEGYWWQQLRKMEDICRQEWEATKDMTTALPNIFFTVAPAEWKYILADGIFYEGDLTEQQNLLTLHFHNTLESLLEVHVLKNGQSLSRIGIAKVRQWSFRFEFQSRGTLHIHAVLWADLLPGWSAANITARSGGNQPSAFLSLLEELFHSRADVQCGDGSHVLLKYVAGYLAKASDALQFQAKQACHENDSCWGQAYRLLAKRSPMQQEITMEFAGLHMVKHSFSGVAMFAPLPGSSAKNAARHAYEAYQHHLTHSKGAFGDARHMTFIQWLRRYRVVSTEGKNFSIAIRNAAGPAKGKACGVAMSFPFELLDIFIGAWAASCMEGMLEERLLPDIDSDLNIPGFEIESARRRAFRAPEGCRYLKAVLSLDDFQQPGPLTDKFAPDVGKFLTHVERELAFRGLGADRIATFKARVHACALLLYQIRDGAEDPELWSARRITESPQRTWSEDQLEVLKIIRHGTTVSDAATAQTTNRLLQVGGGPGTGKTEVVIAAAKQALEDGCRVLIAGPIGLLVSMYRLVLESCSNRSACASSLVAKSLNLLCQASTSSQRQPDDGNDSLRFPAGSRSRRSVRASWKTSKIRSYHSG